MIQNLQSYSFGEVKVICSNSLYVVLVRRGILGLCLALMGLVLLVVIRVLQYICN